MADQTEHLIASEYAGKQGGVHHYRDTFRLEDGTEEVRETLSEWSPEKLNKLRSTTPGPAKGVKIAGYGMAEKMPSITTKGGKPGKSLVG
jgi:hypothetical protein